MLALQLGLVLALLVVCAFAPGFFFVRRLPWGPMEKLCGSIGLSLILIYLAAWTCYCFAPGWESRTFYGVAFYGVTATSVALGFLARKDLFSLARSFRVRRALLGFSFLLVWTILILSMIRNYSGAGWAGDWVEHFQRTLFFLHRLPVNTPIFGGYPLPARPPMMNVLAAFFLAQTGDRFEVFQVVFTFLNLLVFLPCCLLLPALAGPKKRNLLRILPLAALFALNPVIMEAATYAWTKSLTAFFVVLALWFYLAAWRKNDGFRMAAAFLALSAGLLVHYSAGPYAVFVGLHYLVCVFRKRENKWRELIILAATCLLLLLTWFGWSIRTYGTHVTFASNTSITPSQPYAHSNARKIAGNIYDSVVPRALREPSALLTWDQPNTAGEIRDNAFIFYQTSAVFGMGLTAGPLVLGILYGVFRHFRGKGSERLFWISIIPFCVVVGIAVAGERDYWGSAQMTLVPLEAIGISLLAASLPLRRIAGMVLIAGCVVDFSFGVFLQARVENMENRAQTVFPKLTYVDETQLLSVGALDSWQRKHDYALKEQWLREITAADQGDPALPQKSATAQRSIDRQDDFMWGGWYGRHGGSIGFLGDRLANSWFGMLDAQSGLLLLLFLGLTWTLWKTAVPACRT